MARRTKLTPDVQDRIVELIRAGSYAETAARAAGIAPSTYWEWLERGRSGGRRGHRDVYAEFADAIKGAEAQAERDAVAAVRAAMPRDWRAAMTFLERRFPGRWRRRGAHAVCVEHGVARGPDVATDDLSDDAQSAIYDALGLVAKRV